MRQQETAQQHQRVTRKTSVLVVENDPTIRGMLQMMLDLEGYTVEAVTGGAEALRQLRVRPQPRVVLVNHLLPDVDGRDVLATAAAHPMLRRHRYVLMSTCVTCDTHHELAHHELAHHELAHHIGILSKPFSVAQLLDVVEDAASHLPATPPLPLTLRASTLVPNARITTLTTIAAVTIAVGGICFAATRATRSRRRSIR